MKVSFPAYYSQFQCLAGSCPDSCCKEWTVDVDETAAQYYRSLPGALGDRLRAVMRTDDDGTTMINEENRCPMWQQDGLCRIQSELGHDALCKTCQEFPRLRHEFGDFTELDLELSCPEAARLIFSPENQQILCAQTSDPEESCDDPDVMAVLLESRDKAMALLEQYPLKEALAILLLYAGAVQSRIDGCDTPLPDFDKCLATAKKFAVPGNMCSIADFFKGLEILTPQWKDRLEHVGNANVSDQFVPLARYGIRRYWLQALSDLDLICRIKFIMIACLLVSSLGGDPVQTAQQFSKEIENDPDNMDAIFDACYTAPAFADTSILGLLLGATEP